MIYEGEPISLEEKGDMVQIVNDPAMRDAMTEILKEVTTPRKVTNLDSLKTLSDVFRYVLALFVHEQNIDYEFISAVLESSQQLFFLENNRKTYLTQYIVDHGIWSNVRMWKECIELNIKRKMNESTERINAR